MKVKALLAALVAALTLAGCGGDTEPREVPDLRGERLDVAERRLEQLRLDYERVGGGALGIVVRSNWRVCDQEPEPGVEATAVTLIVARSCPPPPAPPPPPPPLMPVPDVVGLTLVDAEELLADRGIAYEEISFEGPYPVAPAWIVCRQRPSAGDRASRVLLYAAETCDGDP